MRSLVQMNLVRSKEVKDGKVKVTLALPLFLRSIMNGSSKK